MKTSSNRRLALLACILSVCALALSIYGVFTAEGRARALLRDREAEFVRKLTPDALEMRKLIGADPSQKPPETIEEVLDALMSPLRKFGK